MGLDKFVKKFLNGDTSAFDEIYNQTRKSVYYVALSVLKDGSLAEDVMQTTYLRVLKNISSYKLGTNVKAWIVKIAKNEALNIHKTRQRECPVNEDDNDAVFGTTEPDRYGELVDLAKRLLPDDEFDILMLITSCGYKRREIGQMFSMPTSTVTWKYNNALEKMRNALEEGV